MINPSADDPFGPTTDNRLYGKDIMPMGMFGGQPYNQGFNPPIGTGAPMGAQAPGGNFGTGVAAGTVGTLAACCAACCCMQICRSCFGGSGGIPCCCCCPTI